jgi:hypothetical protein
LDGGTRSLERSGTAIVAVGVLNDCDGSLAESGPKQQQADIIWLIHREAMLRDGQAFKRLARSEPDHETPARCDHAMKLSGGGRRITPEVDGVDGACLVDGTVCQRQLIN